MPVSLMNWEYFMNVSCQKSSWNKHLFRNSHNSLDEIKMCSAVNGWIDGLVGWLIDWLIDWLLYSTRVPKILLDKILLTIVKNANITIIKLLTGLLMAHQHIRPPVTVNNVIIITIGITARRSRCTVSRLSRMVDLTVDISCLIPLSNTNTTTATCTATEWKCTTNVEQPRDSIGTDVTQVNWLHHARINQRFRRYQLLKNIIILLTRVSRL